MVLHEIPPKSNVARPTARTADLATDGARVTKPGSTVMEHILYDIASHSQYVFLPY